MESSTEASGTSKKMIAVTEMKCEEERHVLDKGEYELVMERMLKMQHAREKEAAMNRSPKPDFSDPKTPDA